MESWSEFTNITVTISRHPNAEIAMVRGVPPVKKKQPYVQTTLGTQYCWLLTEAFSGKR